MKKMKKKKYDLENTSTFNSKDWIPPSLWKAQMITDSLVTKWFMPIDRMAGIKSKKTRRKLAVEPGSCHPVKCKKRPPNRRSGSMSCTSCGSDRFTKARGGRREGPRV